MDDEPEQGGERHHPDRSEHGLRAGGAARGAAVWTSRLAQSTTTSTLWCCSRVTLTSCRRWSGPLRPALSARQPHGQPEGVDCRRSPTSPGNTAFVVTTTTKPAVASTTGRGCAPPLGLLRLPSILPAVCRRLSGGALAGLLLQTTKPAVPSIAGRGCAPLFRLSELSSILPAVCRRPSVVRWRGFLAGGSHEAGERIGGLGRSARAAVRVGVGADRGGGLDGLSGPWPSRAERRQLRRSRADGRLGPPAGWRLRRWCRLRPQFGPGPLRRGAEAGRVAAVSRRVAGLGAATGVVIGDLATAWQD